MTPPAPESVLVVAPFDEAMNAHSAMRCRALERLGVAVAGFNLLQRRRWWTRGPDSAARLSRALEHPAYRWVLLVGPPPFDADVLLNLRRTSSARWALWLPGPAPPPPRLGPALELFDLLAVGGSDVARMLHQAGYPDVRYLPAGCDPSFHPPLRARDRFRANVVFAGKATPRREELLSEVVEFGLAIWGPGWRRTSLREYCRGQLLSALDYVRAYSGATVAINIHHDLGPAAAAGVNQRLFELAAMGACQVVDYREDLERHFSPGSDLYVFQDTVELNEIVKSALLDMGRSEGLGRAARRLAIQRHTYMHRLQQLAGWAGLATVRSAGH